MVKIACPSCGAVLAGGDVNIVAMTGVCRSCGELFRLPSDAEPEVPRPPTDAERPRQVVIEDAGGALRMSWRWWRWQYAALVLFVIAWDSFLVFWYSMAFFGVRHGHGGEALWIMFVFPILHLAVGVGLTYFLIAAALNRTVIQIDAYQLSVRVGPVPWRGSRDYPRESLRRLRLSATTRRNRGMETTSYAVVAEVEGLGPRPICARFADRAHATYVARAIAAALALPLGDEE